MSDPSSTRTTPRSSPLKRQLMMAFALFTLTVSALFVLFAMAFVYTVEDRFLEGMLRDEAYRQLAHHEATGRWAVPQKAFITLHESLETIPAEVRSTLVKSPNRREFAGDEGRHYHLLSLDRARTASQSLPKLDAWLLAEVSGELVVRPRRGEMLAWLTGWALVAIALSLALAAWLAYRVSAPIAKLANRVSSTRLSGPLPAGSFDIGGSAEVVELAHAFAQLTERTRAFIERESRFTREASHELRTPLTVLRMSIERLQSDPNTPIHVASALAGMGASVHAMEQSVEGLLTLARENETLTPQTETALLPAIESWIIANEHWIGLRGVTIDLNVPPTATLRMSAAAVHLVIANLLGNALIHGSRNANVIVRADGDSLTVENVVDVLASADASTPRSGGLGLAIVRRTLESSGYALRYVNDRRVARVDIVRERDAAITSPMTSNAMAKD